MAELVGRCDYPPYEIGTRLALLLDLSLEAGVSPVHLLDEEAPASWSQLDLEVVSQWKSLKETKCPGCGRPLSQHLYNDRLGREETPDDYTPYSVDCPAQQAIANGQEMWKKVNKSSMDSFYKGHGPDPSMGLYWLAQGQGESLPHAGPSEY